MVFFIIGLIIFLILALIAIRIGVNKEQTEIEETRPVIHQSGIYSVVKKSPRESVVSARPREDEVRQYLNDQTVDSIQQTLNQQDKNELTAHYFSNLDANINVIENGDIQGCDFYHYAFENSDPVCKSFISEGDYITREDIFKHQQLIPPFHLGCRCKIRAQHGDEQLRDTTALRLKPLLSDDNAQPQLPQWTEILKLKPNDTPTS
jgi:hypothetical protein